LQLCAPQLNATLSEISTSTQIKRASDRALALLFAEPHSEA
jgi:hypothetical protein